MPYQSSPQAGAPHGAMPPAPMDQGQPAPDLSQMPPAPGDLLGSQPAVAPPSVTVWVPLNADVTDANCAEIGGTTVEDGQGQRACFVSTPGEAAPLPPGFAPAQPDGTTQPRAQQFDQPDPSQAAMPAPPQPGY